jgi:hypothetical protein
LNREINILLNSKVSQSLMILLYKKIGPGEQILDGTRNTQEEYPGDISHS